MNRDFTDKYNLKDLIKHKKTSLHNCNISFTENSIQMHNILNVPAGSFLIRVQGDSMINAGINSGDYILAQNNFSSALGKIIIAQIDNMITLKKYVKKGNEYLLMPANDKYSPIRINDFKNFRIWGIASKVIKDVTDRIG